MGEHDEALTGLLSSDRRDEVTSDVESPSPSQTH